MDFKYYNTKISTDSRVSYKLLGEKDLELKDVIDFQCFSLLTYQSINNDVKKVVVYRHANKIPYDYSIMQKWIKEITELGFPCRIKKNKQNNKIIHFIINLKDYQYKHHLSCALQLVRCLFEYGVCYVPEIYFNLIEQNPETDHFDVLQTAHKKLKEVEGNYDYNDNHTIISRGDKSKNITKEELFQRVKAANKNVYDSNGMYSSGYNGNNQYVTIHSLWVGKSPIDGAENS